MTIKKMIPEAREGLNKTKIEAAKDINFGLNDEYKSNRTSKANGNMVKRMIEEYERNLIGK